MQKNVAGQKVGVEMVSATDGSAFTGSVTVAVTVDAGTQATGSVGSGACTHEGNGYHTYAPAQAETNGDLIAFTFTGTGAVPQTVQVYTRAATPDVNVASISGDTTAADRLEALMDGILVAQVNDVSASTTAFVADGFTEATNDHFNGRLITFLSGALAGQQTDITDYDGATQTITVTALTEAPANDDFFVIH